MILSIIIVTHNSARHIEACLRSIAAPPDTTEIMVFDNRSTDETVELVRWYEPTPRLIPSERNLGFARAANLAAAAAEGRHLLFLNPDLRFVSGSPSDLVEFAEARPDLGAVAPLLVDAEGRRQRWGGRFPSLRGALLDAIGAARSRSPVAAEDGRVDWVLGAAMLVPSKTFRAVGGFDEEYFLYGEDKDLCRRLAQRGSTVHRLEGVRALHDGGGSGGDPAQLGRYFYRAQARYLSKFHGRPARVGHAALRIVGATLRLAISALLAIPRTQRSSARRRIAFYRGALERGWSVGESTGPVDAPGGTDDGR